MLLLSLKHGHCKRFQYNSGPNSPFTQNASSVPVNIYPKRDFSKPTSDNFQAKTQPQPQSEPTISSATFQPATVLTPRPVTFVDPQSGSNKSPTPDRKNGPKSPGVNSRAPHRHRATYKGQFQWDLRVLPTRSPVRRRNRDRESRSSDHAPALGGDGAPGEVETRRGRLPFHNHHHNLFFIDKPTFCRWLRLTMPDLITMMLIGVAAILIAFSSLLQIRFSQFSSRMAMLSILQ